MRRIAVGDNTSKRLTTSLVSHGSSFIMFHNPPDPTECDSGNLVTVSEDVSGVTSNNLTTVQLAAVFELARATPDDTIAHCCVAAAQRSTVLLILVPAYGCASLVCAACARLGATRWLLLRVQLRSFDDFILIIDETPPTPPDFKQA